MLIRSWTAMLLLINYLMVVGMGCISRPEDQHELLLVQTNVDGHHYQECRYLRMDGLEAFLTEALASRYQHATDSPKHHLISVVSGVDAHCLTPVSSFLVSPMLHKPTLLVAYQSPVSVGVVRVVYSPPRLG